MKKYVSLKRYIAYLRKQPAHMQHVYAATFAGIITAFLAFIILYSDYGFFHEKYVREEKEEVVSEAPPSSKSPFQMFGEFMGEASEKIKNIRNTSAGLFDGTEVYSKNESVGEEENIQE